MSVFVRKLRNWRFNSQHDIEGIIDFDPTHTYRSGQQITVRYAQITHCQDVVTHWRAEEQFLVQGYLNTIVYILPKTEENR